MSTKTGGETANINTRKYWDRVYRDEWKSGEILTRRDYGPMHDTIVALIPPGAHVLDIGCGPGILCRKIVEQVPGVGVTGIDFSEYTIVKNAARDSELGITYRCLDIRSELAGIEDRYDVVTMCEVLEHLDEPERAVSAAIALVRLGGRFILTCPHDGEVPHAEHVREWGHDAVFHLLARYGEEVTFHRIPPPRDRWLMADVVTTRAVARSAE